MILPAQPYVPGRTRRPPEGAYDALKAVTDPLEASPAWQAGRHFFAAGYDWEAHEVWEAVWMAAPENSAEKCLVQGAIQLANARLKRRMGLERAAARLDALAEGLLREACARGTGPVMGLARPATRKGLHYSAYFLGILGRVSPDMAKNMA